MIDLRLYYNKKNTIFGKPIVLALKNYNLYKKILNFYYKAERSQMFFIGLNKWVHPEYVTKKFKIINF